MYTIHNTPWVCFLHIPYSYWQDNSTWRTVFEHFFVRNNANQSEWTSFLTWNGNKQLIFLSEGKELSQPKSICLLSLALIPAPNGTVEILITSQMTLVLPANPHGYCQLHFSTFRDWHLFLQFIFSALCRHNMCLFSQNGTAQSVDEQLPLNTFQRL